MRWKLSWGVLLLWALSCICECYWYFMLVQLMFWEMEVELGSSVIVVWYLWMSLMFYAGSKCELSWRVLLLLPALLKQKQVYSWVHSVSPSVTLLGCLFYVICNSRSFHSILFKLCIMIVHILKMCTSYFEHITWIFFSFLRGVEHRHFSLQNAYMVSGLCNL